MALTRVEARALERGQLQRYLIGYEDDGVMLSSGLIAEAIQAFDDMSQASAENVWWATVRHAAGDPGTLRAKIAVRAKRNGPVRIDNKRLRRMFDQLIPAGLSHTLAVESALAEVAESVGIVAQPDAYEQVTGRAG